MLQPRAMQKAMANTSIGREAQEKVWRLTCLSSERFCAFGGQGGSDRASACRIGCQVAVNTSCLAIAFSLSELVNHLDLGSFAALAWQLAGSCRYCAAEMVRGIPFASHNMRMRIRKDSKLSDRLRAVTSRLDRHLSTIGCSPQCFNRSDRVTQR